MQWISLAANVVLMMSITRFLRPYMQKCDRKGFCRFRRDCRYGSDGSLFLCDRCFQNGISFFKKVKKTLREAIYTKLLKLGAAYKEQIRTSEIVQVAVEGIDQLETYFGAYLPQFFYAMLAP